MLSFSLSFGGNIYLGFHLPEYREKFFELFSQQEVWVLLQKGCLRKEDMDVDKILTFLKAHFKDFNFPNPTEIKVSI